MVLVQILNTVLGNMHTVLISTNRHVAGANISPKPQIHHFTVNHN